MKPEITADLKKEEQSDFQQTFMRDCLGNIRRSRSDMSQRYPDWDLQDQVYRGERQMDFEDEKQEVQGKPVKMIVPNTYAQVMTFVSFLFLMYKQNDTFFELKPTGTEDFGKKWEDCESVLDKDWRHSMGSKTLFQYLLDVARFGVAPLEVSWDKEVIHAYVVPEAPTTQTLGGSGIPVSAPLPGGYQEFTKFEGNTVRNVSPYRWFPDTRFALCDFQKGDFCACEEDFTMGALRQLESQGLVAGVQYIKPLPANLSSRENRGADTRASFTFGNDSKWSNGDDNAPVIVTKMRKKIVPKNYKVDNVPIGTEDFQVLYTVWIANDSRIIKLEPCEEWHGMFGYSVGLFTPDMHETMRGFSLAGLVYRLQDVISWFVNSHITSVRRVIQNRMVINTSFVDTKSVDGEGDVYIKKGVGRIDPKQAISQLPAQDVTAGHMGDVDILGKLMQMVTGVNDNAMGQYNSGRRSASEARVVTAGAAGRMKMHGHLLWEGGLAQVGLMMLSNSRQSVSLEMFARKIGMDPRNPDLLQRYSDFKGMPEEVICQDDFLVFDSTLSSEKGFMAQNVQELLNMLLTANPMTAQQITAKLDPLKLIEDMQYLRDGTPIERFYYNPGEGPMLPPQVGPDGQPIAPTPPVPVQ